RPAAAGRGRGRGAAGGGSRRRCRGRGGEAPGELGCRGGGGALLRAGAGHGEGGRRGGGGRHAGLRPAGGAVRVPARAGSRRRRRRRRAHAPGRVPWRAPDTEEHREVPRAHRRGGARRAGGGRRRAWPPARAADREPERLPPRVRRGQHLQLPGGRGGPEVPPAAARLGARARSQGDLLSQGAGAAGARDPVHFGGGPGRPRHGGAGPRHHARDLRRARPPQGAARRRGGRGPRGGLRGAARGGRRGGGRRRRARRLSCAGGPGVLPGHPAPVRAARRGGLPAHRVPGERSRLGILGGSAGLPGEGGESWQDELRAPVGLLHGEVFLLRRSQHVVAAAEAGLEGAPLRAPRLPETDYRVDAVLQGPHRPQGRGGGDDGGARAHHHVQRRREGGGEDAAALRGQCRGRPARGHHRRGVRRRPRRARGIRAVLRPPADAAGARRGDGQVPAPGEAGRPSAQPLHGRVRQVAEDPGDGHHGRHPRGLPEQRQEASRRLLRAPPAAGPVRVAELRGPVPLAAPRAPRGVQGREALHGPGAEERAHPADIVVFCRVSTRAAAASREAEGEGDGSAVVSGTSGVVEWLRLRRVGEQLFAATFVIHNGLLPLTEDQEPREGSGWRAAECPWDSGDLDLDLLRHVPETEDALHLSRRVLLRGLVRRQLAGVEDDVPTLVRLWALGRWPQCRDAGLVSEAFGFVSLCWRALRSAKASARWPVAGEQGAAWLADEENLFQMFSDLEFWRLQPRELLTPWLPPQLLACHLAARCRLLDEQQRTLFDDNRSNLKEVNRLRHTVSQLFARLEVVDARSLQSVQKQAEVVDYLRTQR
ncbi:unnamed protein product, partial [Prorocentrum cordatum]